MGQRARTASAVAEIEGREGEASRFEQPSRWRVETIHGNLFSPDHRLYRCASALRHHSGLPSSFVGSGAIDRHRRPQQTLVIGISAIATGADVKQCRWA